MESNLKSVSTTGLLKGFIGIKMKFAYSTVHKNNYTAVYYF